MRLRSKHITKLSLKIVKPKLKPPTFVNESVCPPCSQSFFYIVEDLDISKPYDKRIMKIGHAAYTKLPTQDKIRLGTEIKRLNAYLTSKAMVIITLFIAEFPEIDDSKTYMRQNFEEKLHKMFEMTVSSAKVRYDQHSGRELYYSKYYDNVIECAKKLAIDKNIKLTNVSKNLQVLSPFLIIMRTGNKYFLPKCLPEILISKTASLPLHNDIMGEFLHCCETLRVPEFELLMTNPQLKKTYICYKAQNT